MLEINNLTKTKVDEKKLKIISAIFIKKYKIEKAEISLVLIGDKRSKTLNRDYRKKDYPTDVLSFSNPDFKQGKDNFLGEIFINLAEVSRLYKYEEMFLELFDGVNEKTNNKFNANNKLKTSNNRKNIEFKVNSRDINKTFKLNSKINQEKFLLNFIFIHGLLHLIGFDDKSEKERKKMLKLGLDFIKML